AMRFGGDVRSSLHDLEFLRTLNHAQFVNDGGCVDDRLWWMDRFAIPAAHQRNLANDLRIEIRLHAEAVIEHFGAVQNLSQLAFKLLDWKRFVRAKFVLRTVDARAPAIPNLALGIARPDKQNVFVCLAGLDHCDRVRFFKTGQVEEIGVLTK